MSCARRLEPGGLEGCAGLLVLFVGACLYLINPLLAYVAGGLLILMVVGAEIGGRWSAVCATVAAAGVTIAIAAGWRSALACLIASAVWTVAMLLAQKFLIQEKEGFVLAVVKNALELAIVVMV